jgi:serine/threonine protein phosphatase PrpC
MIKGTN